ncbi:MULTISPECIES: cell division protein FtsZ [unclassified Roseitalea]|uniref:cell division protein FtsZ n=1 Tax=unclassified Roseitalea TaxID=2639107 RepID=UPI00273DEA66|nr:MULTISPECIES: cell division protein FtsZ [unclassified Roseitalea]
MTINLKKPDITELKPRITVFGVGGGGGNAVNNMITGGLDGVEFVVANTDAQALMMNKAERIIQLGMGVTEGLGAGSQPDVGRAAAEECIDEINDHLSSTHMCFVTAGMGGGTGTGAAPVVARAARERGILTVGVVTKPFHFEGQRRMRTADAGIEELQANVDTLIVIPNQNLFRIANDKTTFADAFAMADQVLYSGVACITDLMVKEGLINLDFADVRSVMSAMGKAMMGTGEASEEGRAIKAAEAAIANPLLDETSMRGAKGLLISITGGRDMTLFEVDEAATRIREEVDQDANIILGATFDESLEGLIRVSVVATGIEAVAGTDSRINLVPRAVTGAASPGTPTASNAKPTLHKPLAPSTPAPAPAREAQPAQTPAAGTQTAIAETERDMNAYGAAKPAEPAPAQPAPAAAQAGEFEPKSRLFRAPPRDPMPARPQTTARAPEPAPAPEPTAAPSVAQQPYYQAEPAASQPAQPTYHEPAAPQQPYAEQQAAQPRMPAVQDFPPIAQAELQAHAGTLHPDELADDRGPLGLLKRLSHGLSRKGEGEEVPAPPRLRPADPAAGPAMEPAAAQPRRQLGQEAQLYAPRSGQLDEHGRPAAQAPADHDDQLEIPAFLRRQANG